MCSNRIMVNINTSGVDFNFAEVIDQLFFLGWYVEAVG